MTFTEARPGHDPRSRTEHEQDGIAFLFSGQGAQFAGMGQGLLTAEPVFRHAFERCAKAAIPFLEKPLSDVFAPHVRDPALLYRMLHAKLGTFAIGHALSELWRSWGVQPDAVLGFSSGEYGAACAAGVIEVEEAVRLLATEALLAERVRHGAMVVVQLSEEEALREVAQEADRVGVAAVLSEQQVSLSGDSAVLARLAGQLSVRGVRVTSLPVKAGLHSPLQEPSLDELRTVASSVSFRAPEVPFVSTVSGTLLPAGEAPSAEHWCRHMRGPVRFLEGVRTLDALGVGTYVETGPGRALSGLGGKCLPGRERVWLASMGRHVDGTVPMLQGLDRLRASGVLPRRGDAPRVEP